MSREGENRVEYKIVPVGEGRDHYTGPNTHHIVRFYPEQPLCRPIIVDVISAKEAEVIETLKVHAPELEEINFEK